MGRRLRSWIALGSSADASASVHRAALRPRLAGFRLQLFQFCSKRSDLFEDQACVVVDGLAVGVGFSLVFLLHGGDDDTDKEVQHREGRAQDEGDKEQPGIGIDIHDRTHDAPWTSFPGS